VTDLELKESLLMPYFIKPLKTRLSIAVRRLVIDPPDDASSSRRGKVIFLRQIVRFCFRLSGKLPIILRYLRNMDSPTRYPECHYGKKPDHQLPHQICSTVFLKA
jgi:hypothetical protein